MSLDILLVLARHSISGVPLAQIRLARALAGRGHRVTLLYGTLDGHHAPIIPGVTVEEIGARQVRGMLWPLVRRLRRADPDVVFTAEDHLNVTVLLAAMLARSKAKISASSRVTPHDTYSNRPLSKRWALKWLSRATAWRADALTCVSRDMVDQYRDVLGSTRHQAIYNIVDDAANRVRAADPLDDPWFDGSGPPVIVAAGALQRWKGFDTLVDALGLLHSQGREARLMILGEGPERAALEARATRLGIADRVRLVGHVDNPLAYFAHASLFVLSSRVEGLPNVLVEALIAGCPVVATDCPTGPREVLDGGRFGALVPVGDAQAMAAAIAATLDKPPSPGLMSEAVRPFAVDAVLARHFASLGLE